MKILTIGNSASLDACHLLNLVASTEGFEGELDIGTLYHSGCRLSRHVEDKTISGLIPEGTAVENALTSYLTEWEIHRDYFHLSDFSRVVASYAWYCTLAGVDRLEEIKLDAIPKAFLLSTEDKTQDRPLSEMEKAIILEAVNNALKNPLQITQSQYIQAPARF